MAIYKASSNDDVSQQKQIEQAKSQFSPQQIRFLQTVGSLFRENCSMPFDEIYEKCGMPHDIAFSHNPQLIREHIPFEKGTDGFNVFETYAMAIDKRDRLKNSPLLELPSDILNLNLNKDEKVYHVIYGLVLYQEKSSISNITYAGVRWTSGPLRTGSMNVITNEINYFAPLDSGKLVFTNNRLIFIGKQKNITKQIKIVDILYHNLYQDGVMVHVPNRKPLLFKFLDNKDFEIYEISDGINEFTIVFNRIVNGNYLENLRENITLDNKKKD